MKTPSYLVTPSKLSGTLRVPPSKSQTLRAILFASLAEGTSTISHYLHSPDTNAMINACEQLGAQITQTAQQLTIQGTGGKLKTPENIIDAGNSGIVLRFITALLALLSDHCVITGDHSIRYQRVLAPLLSALEQLGATCITLKKDGKAPVIIQGAIKAGNATLSGEDSQCVSALLIAASLLPGETIINVENPGEIPWVSLTCHWLKRVQVNFSYQNFQTYRIQGGAIFSAFDYVVPGDWSTALFPIVAALVTQTSIMIQGLDLTDPQGDKAVLEILREMNANLHYDSVSHTLTVFPSTLTGGIFAINHIIDALPALAVLGCFAQTPLTLKQVGIARKKESDRLTAISTELQKMGANIILGEDELVVQKSELVGAMLNTHRDHRVGMALTVAALGANSNSEICDVAWINKTYPNFHVAMQKLNAKVILED